MKIVILGQEEPIYFSPFLRSIVEACSSEISAVAVVGSRGAGGHPKTIWGKLQYFYSLWRLLEPAGFCKHLFCRKKRILENAARSRNIPLYFVQDVNGPEFLATLSSLAPDLVINQTECLLKKELLSIPKLGVLNRHASLLPHFRGRVGSFWGHAEEPPEYGVTIHFVNEGIDAGPIVVQKRFDLDPRFSYAQVLQILFQESLPLLLKALEKLKQPDFICIPNEVEGHPPRRFPSLKEIQCYRDRLAKRRRRLHTR